MLIHVSRLDVTSSGRAVVQADWQIVPRSATLPTIRNRVRFSARGSVGSDESVVRFERTLFDRLAQAIDLSSLR